LTLNGGGISSDGAFAKYQRHQLLERAITLGSASTIAQTDTLTLSGNIDSGGFLLTIKARVSPLRARISGAGADKAGFRRADPSGANTYTDATTISAAR